ncbi:protein kinase [Streptomyces sp. NBC_01381]|uniref:protein kinase domain-containing protein n=1 Tax=Streptomyces sp. NBC_01381 TaxID=2903845 RepID=UPI002B1D7DB9|nr:protein kinase [Streptomyces sp. NBC_01381]
MTSVPVGYRIGAWEVGARISAGAFARVYAGRRVPEDPLFPRPVALKFLPTGASSPRRRSSLRELVQREVQLLRAVRGPRLIRMYDSLTVTDAAHPHLDGATVLALERAAHSLDVVLERQQEPVSGELLTHICEGLAQLHGAGWVHGDLKPGNVLLMPDGTARLADFNLAAQLEGSYAYAPAFRTTRFTPPELIWAECTERGHPIRTTTDIWAFGMLAHLALTGASPFPGGTPSATLKATVGYARGSEPLRLSPRLPAAWREIITDCLAPTHELRARHDARSLLRRVAAA